MPAKVQKSPLLSDGQFNVSKVVELNFFDLSGKKSKTKGSSNKTYRAEIQIAKSGNKAQIFSMWGPTGGNLTKDWRHYDSASAAEKDFEKIIKSKKKKGYKEIDVAIRAHGSEEAKKIVKPITGSTLTKSVSNSTLHPKVQYLIGELFGSTNQWVIDTLKCPLGQLSGSQIDKGRNILSEANQVNKKKRKSKKDKEKIENLTNDFYTLIPHNLGTGSRGQLTHLLLDDSVKIAQKESDLDTLADAKSVGSLLSNNEIDNQYKSLNADFKYIEDQDPLFSWINNLVQKTRARNHHYLGKIEILNLWKLERNLKKNSFLDSIKDISRKCKGQVIPKMYNNLGVDNRKEAFDHELYKKANVLPLFHGTRTENLIGITKKGLLIRPHNAVLTGAMYGNGIYKGFSSKSINYTNIRSSYWAKGNSDKAYLFLCDTILGNQLIAKGSYQYSEKNINPNHSVWAKGGQSGVINDEFIIYNANQSMLRYLIEFTCK